MAALLQHLRLLLDGQSSSPQLFLSTTPHPSAIQTQPARVVPTWKRWRCATEEGVLEHVLRLQQQRGDRAAGGGLALLPVSVVRSICQQLSHSDIEQARLVCKEWRTSFGASSVSDMYLAMCADYERAAELTSRFAKAYPNFHHLHFWIPGGPVRQMMGTDSSTFRQYMELFAKCSVRVLTAHYLDDQVCPVAGITRLSGLTKLELVDLMPASASLACLSGLPHLRHLIVEYKDSVVPPDLQSIGELHGLTHLELALHSTFVSNPVYLTLPGAVKAQPGALTGDVAAAKPLSEGLASLVTAAEASTRLDGMDGHATLQAILEAIVEAALAGQQQPGTEVAEGELLEGMSDDEGEISHVLEVQEPAGGSGQAQAGLDADAAEQEQPSAAAHSWLSSSPDEAAEVAAMMAHWQQLSAEQPAAAPASAADSLMPASSLSCAEVVAAPVAAVPAADGLGPCLDAGEAGAALACAGNEGAAAAGDQQQQQQQQQPASAAPGDEAATHTFGVARLGLCFPDLIVGESSSVDIAADAGGSSSSASSSPGSSTCSSSQQPDSGRADRGIGGAAGGSGGGHRVSRCEEDLEVVVEMALQEMVTEAVELAEMEAEVQALVDAGQPLVPAPAAAAQPSDIAGGGAAASTAAPAAASAPAPAPTRTLSVSSSDYVLAHMMAHWSRLRCLQRLEVRSAPVGLAHCYPLLFGILPSLTELKLVGPDARLKVYGSSQPAFKVEVNRDPSSMAVGPATLALSLHCDTPADTTAALQQLVLIANTVAPASSSRSAAAAAPAAAVAAAPSVGSNRQTGAGAAPSAGPAAAWVPWISPPAGGPAGAPRSPGAAPAPAPVLPPLSSAAAAASAAAEEKRRLALMQAHPSLGVLQAHAAKLATLRLCLENPDFSMLKPLTSLSHMQELYISMCYTSGSDSESEDDLPPGIEVESSSDDDDASVAPPPPLVLLQQAQAAVPAASAAASPVPAAAEAGAAAAEGAEAAAVEAAGPGAGGPPVDQLAAEPNDAAQAEASDEDGAGPGHAGGESALPTLGSIVATAIGAGAAAAAAASSAGVVPPVPTGAVVAVAAAVAAEQQSSSRNAPAAWSSPELNPRHIMSVLRGLPHLTSLTVREEIPANEDSSPCSHEQCSLGPASCDALVRSLKHLVHLEWQGMLAAPHPSSLQALAGLASLRSLTLVVNQDDPMARLGLHCLPPSLTSLTLQNISVARAPRGAWHKLPSLCHLHLKSCSLPDVSAFAAAPALEWLSLDNCDVAVYLSDLVDLWPSLSWLEITYTHQDWRLLHSPTDLPSLSSLTRLRKLSLVTPYEENLTTEALLTLTQLRLLSISPSPAMNYEQFMRLADLRFLAGLEVKLYTDVLHHEELVDMAGAMHADLQEGLPMTDVLIMVDDTYADDPA